MMRQDMVSFGLANVQPVLLRTAVEYELNNFHTRHERVDRTRRWIHGSFKRDTSMNGIWSDAMTKLFDDVMCMMRMHGQRHWNWTLIG